MSDGSGLWEGTGSDGSKEKGREFNTIYFYRGSGRITGGTSRGRGKRENDGGESSRGGRERGKGRGRMNRKDGGESSGAGGGRGRGSERGRSSGRGITDREDGGTTRERSNGGGGEAGRGKIHEVSEEGRRKAEETGKGRSNGRGQAKGRVNQNRGTEISNKGTKGKRSDKEDKGMSRGDRGKEREGSAGGPGESSAFIRTLVGQLLTGRFDDGGGIKISGDEGAQSRFDETDRREKVKTSWPSDASAVGGKGEIRSAVGGKETISSTVGGKGEISSAAGKNTKTTRRKLKIKKKIDKEPYYKRARVVRKPPRSTLLIDKSTRKFMAVWKRRRLLRYRVKAERTLLQKKKTYRTEWKVRNKFGIREFNNQVTRWKFILNSDQGRQAKESKIQLIYSTSKTAPAPKIPTPAPQIQTPAPIKRPALGGRKTQKAPKPRKVPVPRYNATIPRYTSYEVRNTSLWSLEFGMFFTQENLSKLGIHIPYRSSFLL